MAETFGRLTGISWRYRTAGGAAFEVGLNFRVAHLSRRVTDGAFGS
jgi:hypothetical protein